MTGEEIVAKCVWHIGFLFLWAGMIRNWSFRCYIFGIITAYFLVFFLLLNCNLVVEKVSR